MDIFKTRLRTALANRNITQAQLAAYAKIDKGSVSGYLSGRCLPSSNRLERIAKVLNVSSSWLLGMDDEPSPVNPNALRVPVLGYIAAGIPIDQIEMVLDYEEMPASASAGGAEFFGLQVKGDSMEPEIRSGDIVILKKQSTCDNGEIAAVAINGDTATLKKISFSNTGIVMVQPINPKYNTVCYTKEQVESIPVTILGVLYEVRRKYKHG